MRNFIVPILLALFGILHPARSSHLSPRCDEATAAASRESIAGEPQHLRIARSLGFETLSAEQARFDEAVLSLADYLTLNQLSDLVEASFGTHVVREIKAKAGEDRSKLYSLLHAKMQLGLFERQIERTLVYTVSGTFGLDPALANRLYPQFELNRKIADRPHDEDWFFSESRPDFYFRPGPDDATVAVIGRLPIVGESLSETRLISLGRNLINDVIQARGEILSVELLPQDPFCSSQSSRAYQALVRCQSPSRPGR